MKRTAVIALLFLICLAASAVAQDAIPAPEVEKPAVPQPQTPEDFFELAVTCFQKGDLAGSERHCRTAIALKSHYQEAHYLLGRVLIFRAAQKNRLLIEQRGSGGAVLPRAEKWAEGENDLQEAVGQFRIVIKLDPSGTDAWLLLGTALDNLGQPDEAINAYKQTINLNPASQNARDAHNNLGLVYLSKKEFAKAKAQFEAALALDPSFNASRLNLEKLRKRKPKLFK